MNEKLLVKLFKWCERLYRKQEQSLQGNKIRLEDMRSKLRDLGHDV